MPKTTNQRCKRTIASRESKKQKRNANTGSLRCQARELTQRWANSEGKLTILLTGKCGVGKSHLANALLGDDKYAEEGRQRNRATTTSLTCHSEKVGNVTVEIFDTPGLQDRHLERETILQEIQEKITNGVHLCVFCLRMDVKILSADVEVMRDISNALNNNWSNAIVALTFANRVACDNLFGNSKSSRRRFFREEMMDCEKVIREDLKNLGVDSSNASKIPIIPVGTYRDPQLPNTEDWLSKFWMKACIQDDKDRIKSLSSSNKCDATARSAKWQYSTASILIIARKQLHPLYSEILHELHPREQGSDTEWSCPWRGGHGRSSRDGLSFDELC